MIASFGVLNLPDLSESSLADDVFVVKRFLANLYHRRFRVLGFFTLFGVPFPTRLGSE